jgi:hypothetical protein
VPQLAETCFCICEIYCFEAIYRYNIVIISITNTQEVTTHSAAPSKCIHSSDQKFDTDRTSTGKQNITSKHHKTLLHTFIFTPGICCQNILFRPALGISHGHQEEEEERSKSVLMSSGNKKGSEMLLLTSYRLVGYHRSHHLFAMLCVPYSFPPLQPNAHACSTPSTTDSTDTMDSLDFLHASSVTTGRSLNFWLLSRSHTSCCSHEAPCVSGASDLVSIDEVHIPWLCVPPPPQPSAMLPPPRLQTAMMKFHFVLFHTWLLGMLIRILLLLLQSTTPV